MRHVIAIATAFATVAAGTAASARMSDAQYLAANRLDDVEKLLQTKVSNNPKDAKSTLELAAYYAGVHRREQMAATLRRATTTTNSAKGSTRSLRTCPKRARIRRKRSGSSSTASR